MKPCPFCGETSAFMLVRPRASQDKLKCHRCGAVGPDPDRGQGLEAAKKGWNTRNGPVESSEVERLKAVITEMKEMKKEAERGLKALDPAEFQVGLTYKAEITQWEEAINIVKKHKNQA